MSGKKIQNDVLAVLARSSTVDDVLFLPPGELGRPLYLGVNKVIEAAGGKWKRGLNGHVFEGDAGEAMEAVLLTGETTNRKADFGQFDTPPAIAERAVALCQIELGNTVLEPSAGRGALAIGAVAAGGLVCCVEIDDKRAAALSETGLYEAVVHEDFLLRRGTPRYDRVLMNPPFAKRADVHHVFHAIGFLKPAGRLVAIMSAGVLFRSDPLTVDFRDMVASHGGMVEELPPESFKSSGTSVNAVVVSFNTDGGHDAR